jgi:hypothetical protein
MAVVAAGRELADRVQIVAVDMGYGHLRAAHALAAVAGGQVLQIDHPPLATAEEARRWRQLRSGYEWISRASQRPWTGPPLRRLLDAITFIPHLPTRDASHPTLGVRWLDRRARRGLGRGMLESLRARGATLLTTFYAPAVIADVHGFPRIVCVVTDTDINRVWAPRFSGATTIQYCAPSEQVVRRLRSFGVPAEKIHLTGFPLPDSLLGGPELVAARRSLAARLVRLDPSGAFRSQAREEISHFLGRLPADEELRPPLLTFAVGGAGAQVDLVRAFLPSLAKPVRRGDLRLALVAGVRRDVAGLLRRVVAEAGLERMLGESVEVLVADGLQDYLLKFDALIQATDVLWTKPSELTFFAALGLPLVMAWPVGVHERSNRRWALHRGAAFKQEDPSLAWEWLGEWLADGTLAAAAWAGYMRLPKFGTYKILDVARRVAAEG